MAAPLIEDATIRSIERELARLNEASAEPGEATTLRTRVLTHTAWVPPEWEAAARAVLDGLGDRVPSRTIMLLPDPESGRDALDAEVDLRCAARGGRERAVCSEVIAIWLRGSRARAPASVVQPLLVSDLPAFLRWRGSLPYGAPELEQLLGVVDRLVVNGREWEDAAAGYRALVPLLDRIAVSDIAWARTRPWREAVAALWPAVATAEAMRVRGPAADALLLAGWLGSRLERDVRLAHEPAREIELVEVDGLAAVLDRPDRPTPSDLLSDQLEIDCRDPVYEDAVAAVGPFTR